MATSTSTFELTVRRAVLADIDDIVEMEQADDETRWLCLGDDLESLAMSIESDDQTLLVVHCGSELVAWVLGEPYGGGVAIALYVSSERRRAGVASHILGLLAGLWPASALRAHVHDGNAASLALLAGNGWSRVGVDADGFAVWSPAP